MRHELSLTHLTIHMNRLHSSLSPSAVHVCRMLDRLLFRMPKEALTRVIRDAVSAVGLRIVSKRSQNNSVPHF